MGEKAKVIKKQHGGVRPNSGRPSVAKEEKGREIMKEALRQLYHKDTDEESLVLFLVDFAQTPRGQQFIAEHLFGKAPQVIENPEGTIVSVPTIIFK